MSCWTIKILAYKLKHFEFLLHPCVSEGHSHSTLSLLRGWKGHSPCPVIDGAWHLPCAWCSLSLAPLVGWPSPLYGCTALTVVGKWPESQAMSRIFMQIDDGNQSYTKKHLHGANMDLVAGPSLYLEPTQDCLALISQFSNQCPISEKITPNCAQHCLWDHVNCRISCEYNEYSVILDCVLTNKSAEWEVVTDFDFLFSWGQDFAIRCR